ncbi:hypothetical protein EV360DRAFT_72850 [Lentinula raphanica]|nr:hypothetical protein EV360DRAFT_72850 [Lentinula raphanica]
MFAVLLGVASALKWLGAKKMSAACAIPVENVPLGQGDSSLASSEGETSQVLPGTLHQQNYSVSGVSRDTPQILERFYHFQSAQRKFSTLRDLQRCSKWWPSIPLPSVPWKTNGQSTVSNGPQSTVSTVPKIIQNCQFCRHREGTRYETDNSETVKDQRADDFSHWIVESAVAKFCSGVSGPEGQRIEFTVGDKVHYPWTMQELLSRPGLTFLVHGVPELGTVVFQAMLYRTKSGGRMSIEAYHGEGGKRTLLDVMISEWEKHLTASAKSLYLWRP